MSSYKLTYFNGKGRAETARTIFKLARVKFQDNRIDMKDWPEYKAQTPFGSMPILEVDGRELVQSKAIYRYLAREFGFYSDNSWECAEIDSVVDMLDDFASTKLMTILTGSGEEKEKAVADYTVQATKVLDNLEKKLLQNDEGDGYFVGEKMTLADIHFYNQYDGVANLLGKDIFSNYPKLSGLRRRVGQNEKIAAWIERRPVTMF